MAHAAGGGAAAGCREFEAAALKKLQASTSRSCRRAIARRYFSHIWGGGYAAGYYAYLWSEVLDARRVHVVLRARRHDRENGKKYRDGVLSRGATKDAHQMYLDFRGKEPTADALLERRGLGKK